MRKIYQVIMAVSATLALLAPGAPAAAAGVSVIATDCVSVSHVDGCLFSGNIAPNFVTDTEDAYNLFNNTHPSAAPDIDLNYLFKSDDGAGFLGTMSGTTSGTWSTPGFLIDFIAVKASNKFVLYKLATPVSSGTWDTFDIPYNNNPHGISHLTFFGAAAPPGVPEPATWAMMLLGFGGMGALMRRNRRQARAACA